MDWLLDPLNYEFMRQALLASVLAGVVCPIIGTYLIVQRMAMLGDVVAPWGAARVGYRQLSQLSPGAGGLCPGDF